MATEEQAEEVTEPTKATEEVVDDTQQEAPIEVDPFIEGLLNSSNELLGEIVKPPEPEPEPLSDYEQVGSVSDQLIKKEILSKNEQEESKEEQESNEEEPKPKATKKVDPKEEEPVADEPMLSLEEVKPPEAPTVSENAPVATDTPVDADFEQGLPEEWKDELRTARYAAQRFPNKFKDMGDKTLNYLKKLDVWLADNPDAEVGSDEFSRFKKQHDPGLTKTDRKLIDRQLLKDEATSDMRAEMDRRQNELDQKIYEMKERPKLDRNLSTFKEGLTNALDADGLGFKKETAQSIEEMGYDRARNEMPVAGSIYAGAVQAADAWMNISARLQPYNPGNAVHDWLNKFVDNESRRFEAEQGDKLTDGRKFMNYHEFYEKAGKDPSTFNEYWTFSPNDVTSKIRNHARKSYARAVKNLEKEGLTVASNGGGGAKKSTVAKQPAQPQSSASPKAGTSSMQGVTPADKGGDKYHPFIEGLFSG